jgi:hypothetical protein
MDNRDMDLDKDQIIENLKNTIKEKENIIGKLNTIVVVLYIYCSETIILPISKYLVNLIFNSTNFLYFILFALVISALFAFLFFTILNKNILKSNKK